MQSKKLIYFEDESATIEYQGRPTVLEAVLKAKKILNHECGGGASCGTCVIQITSSLKELPLRNELEAELANAMNYQEDERLACQLECVNGLRFKRG